MKCASLKPTNLLRIIAIVIGAVGIYTFLYADHFAYYKSFVNDPQYVTNPTYQSGAETHDHWRIWGLIYLSIATIVWLLSRLGRNNGGGPASFAQRVLARIDQIVSSLFRLQEYEFKPGCQGATSERHYFNFGPYCGIVHADGSMEIGTIFEMVHLYDCLGKLLLRRSRWKLPRLPGDRFIYGRNAVTSAYRCVAQRAF